MTAGRCYVMGGSGTVRVFTIGSQLLCVWKGYGSLVLFSYDLSFDNYSFARICGNTDCRPLTATFTPHEPGIHHVLVAVYSYTAGYDPVVEGYVEFRANVIAAAPRR